MAKFEIRIVGKRREAIDVDRLAEALLDLIEHLGNSDRRKMASAGKRALTRSAGGQPKGTAA